MKYDIINDIKLLATIYRRLSKCFEVIRSNVALQKQVHQNKGRELLSTCKTETFSFAGLSQ